MTIYYILSSFGTFFPVLVSCTKKNLATLLKCLSWLQVGRGWGAGATFLVDVRNVEIEIVDIKMKTSLIALPEPILT
jgi:hypothetical protein